MSALKYISKHINRNAPFNSWGSMPAMLYHEKVSEVL